MIVKVEIEWHKAKEITFPFTFWKDVVLIIKTIDRVVAVDVCREELGKYKPPLRARVFSFYYEIGKVSEGDTKYLECIANQLQDKLNPYIKKQFNCNQEVTILL